MIATLLCLALHGAPAVTAAATAAGPESDVILDAMKDELARAAQLKLANTPAPYWASYQVVDVEAVLVSAKFGALVNSSASRSRALAPRLRVGDLQLDAVGVPISDEPLVGYEADYDALRHALWRYTDGAYKMAATQYRREVAQKAQTTADPDRPSSFTTAPPVISIAKPLPANVDRKALEALARRVSAVFREHDHILDNAVSLSFSAVERRFVSTDGAAVLDGSAIIAMTIDASTQATDGDMIGRRKTHLFRPGELPDAAVLEADATQIAKDLLALRTAPLVRDYSGPLLFEPEAAGDLFASVMSTQLVASGNWNGEVDGKFGQLVLPKGVDVVDDPIATQFEGKPLLGTLGVDDEGVQAERVQLIRDGKLVGLLAGRAPGKKVKRSNGHGRSAPYGMDVRPGTTNLIISAKTGLSAAAMEKKLLALVRERGAEFGIIISGADSHGGVTAYRLDKDGKRELVRVGYLQGLEFRQLREVVALGKTRVVRHGMQMGGQPMPVGAMPPTMAGFVSPMSVVAPAILLRDAELHAFVGDNPKPPAYPRPTFSKR